MNIATTIDAKNNINIDLDPIPGLKHNMHCMINERTSEHVSYRIHYPEIVTSLYMSVL